MNVTHLYFAALREALGRAEEVVPLPDDVRVASELRGYLEQRHPALRGRLGCVRIAANEQFVDDTYQLRDGDVIAWIPPVAGG